MIDAVLDATVILHFFRKCQPAISRFNNQQRYGVTSTTWLEVVEGTRSKATQVQYKALLRQVDLLYPTSADQQWAMQATYRRRGRLPDCGR